MSKMKSKKDEDKSYTRCSSCGHIVLPFLPKHESELICQDNLLITWFETAFSQSHYHQLKENSCGSNACTIIALLVAAYCNKSDIQITWPRKSVDYYLVIALGVSMIKGNTIHETLRRRGRLPNVNLTIPEAIRCASRAVKGIKEWKSVLYMQLLIKTLWSNLQLNWEEWMKTKQSKVHQQLYVILICDARSVLFIIDNREDTITLVDSHQHNTRKGATIVTAYKRNCRCLCAWFSHSLMKYFESAPSLYELSFLYFTQPAKQVKKP